MSLSPSSTPLSLTPPGSPGRQPPSSTYRLPTFTHEHPEPVLREALAEAVDDIASDAIQGARVSSSRSPLPRPRRDWNSILRTPAVYTEERPRTISSPRSSIIVQDSSLSSHSATSLGHAPPARGARVTSPLNPIAQRVPRDPFLTAPLPFYQSSPASLLEFAASLPQGDKWERLGKPYAEWDRRWWPEVASILRGLLQLHLHMADRNMSQSKTSKIRRKLMIKHKDYMIHPKGEVSHLYELISSGVYHTADSISLYRHALILVPSLIATSPGRSLTQETEQSALNQAREILASKDSMNEAILLKGQPALDLINLLDQVWWVNTHISLIR
jgi:hypothetical protein